MRFAITGGGLMLASALALAACGGGTSDADGDGEISAAEMKAEVDSLGNDIKPEPGKYSSKITFVNANIPGLPESMKEQFGQQMSNSFEYCLTAEEAEQSGFEEALKESQDDSCTVKTFEMSNGNVDMSMSCAAEGGTMDVKMTGKVSPTKMEIDVVSAGNITGVGDASFEMNMVQERIGECDPDAK